MPTGKHRRKFPELYGYQAAQRTRARTRSKKTDTAVEERIEADNKKEQPVASEEKYTRIARRLGDAVKELNEALIEAHREPEMQVFFAWDKNDKPMQFEYEIFRMTHKNSVVDIEQTATAFKYRSNNPVPQ